MRKLGSSPFQVEYWLNKGYSLEQSQYEVRSRRPTNIEYYIKKYGSSPEEAEKLRCELSKKGAMKNAARSKEQHRKSSHRCHEYWLERGFSMEESLTKVAEVQATFSLERCVKKYGEFEGKKRCEERQQKWQKTLNNRDSHNDKMKAVLSVDRLRKKFFNEDDVWNELKSIADKRNMKLFKTLKEFQNHVDTLLKTSPTLKYLLPNKLLKKFPKVQFQWLNIEIEDVYNHVNVENIHFINGKYHGYRKWVGNSLLRSAHEITFYDMLKEHHIECVIDNCYPNSNMRYDFFLPKTKHYVEIAPMYGKNEKYTIKMNAKKELFGCTILTSIDEYKSFVTSLT